MAAESSAAKLGLAVPQFEFLQEAQASASSIVEAAFTTQPNLANELFPTDLRKSREQVLAHKLIQYIVQSEANGEELEGITTIADAVLELAPGNFNRGSRKQRKAVTAVNEWFDIDHAGSRIIGSSLLSVIEHHRQRTAQRVGEIRNRHLGSEVEEPEFLFTTSEGLVLFELSSKAHLEDESAVTGHCVGTGTYYATMMAKGQRRFFSLRNPDPAQEDKYERTTVEYDTEKSTVRQMRGKHNAGIDLASPHLQSVLEALGFIRDNILEVKPGSFKVQDFNLRTVADVNFDSLRKLDYKALPSMAAYGVLKIPVNLHIDERFVDADLGEAAEILSYCDIKELVIDARDNDMVAQILEKVGHFGGNVTFNNLESASGLDRIKTVKGYIHFPSLTDSRGLEGLREVSGDARFPKLTDASGLRSLLRIGGRAFFGSLESSAGLSSLVEIGKGAHFMSLRDASRLTSLESIGSRAHFEELESATGLERLTHIGGRAYFNNLRSSKGLESVRYIGGYVYADLLPQPERKALRSLIGVKRKKR